MCSDRTPELPAITRMRTIFRDGLRKAGLCPAAPQRIYDEMSAAKFQNVVQETYSAGGKDGLQPIARKWLSMGLPAVLIPILAASGEVKDEEEAKQQIEALAAEFHQHSETAQVLANYKVIVGQKRE